MIKLAQHQEEFYVGAKSAPQKLDFRLAYLSKALIDELVAEGAILVDSTGMLKRESEKGIYKLKLSSDSVPVVFADVIKRTGFLRKHNTDCLFIQEGQSLRSSTEIFLADQWRDAKIKPGDIIVLIEW
ncbi:MAG: hypothetical protein WC205_16070 [Opitutaceae bacterium]|jgi:hypothetical protein